MYSHYKDIPSCFHTNQKRVPFESLSCYYRNANIHIYFFLSECAQNWTIQQQNYNSFTFLKHFSFMAHWKNNKYGDKKNSLRSCLSFQRESGMEEKHLVITLLWGSQWPALINQAQHLRGRWSSVTQHWNGFRGKTVPWGTEVLINDASVMWYENINKW